MHALQILEFYLEAGVDEAVDEQPADRLTPQISSVLGKEMVKISSDVSRETFPSLAVAAPSEAIARTRALADAAQTLAELEAAVRGFEAISLKKTAMNTVFSDGNPKARIMLIGEAPGAQEDQQGIPFCGPSGKLLDKMLAAIGLTREHVYITNTVFWRPPGNRQPTTEELAVCEPFVQKHIALINPGLLILCGGVATTAVLKKALSLSRLRMKMHDYTNPYIQSPLPAAVTFHPSYLMRSPSQKRLAWQDWQFMRDEMESLSPVR